MELGNIFKETYKIISFLASGVTGKVFLVENINTGK
jgi:hypothetical protein